jgi:myxalamid-type polyketide synthase MxaB
LVASEVAAVMSIDRSELDVDQPLNALGLDSLMGIELKVEIETRLRIKLPMAALLDGPTVSSLAEHASKAVASASDELSQHSGGETVAAPNQRHGISLALLASGGSGAPLFCVHPVGGDIRCYYQLAKAVADSRPVYAFRARGLDAASQPHRSVVELAGDYVQAMREMQPSGPYHLCGWSTGGIFAYEMARQLEAAGDRVGALVFLDTPVPAIFQDVDLDDEPRFLFDLVNFSNWFAGTQMEVDYQELKRLGAEQSLHYVLDQARKHQVLPANASIAYLQRLVHVCRDHVRAIRDYELKPISQTVEMIQPSDTSALAEASGQVLGDELGWRAVVGDRLTVDSVPGDHFSMLTGEHAPILARAVERRLADVSTARQDRNS